MMAVKCDRLFQVEVEEGLNNRSLIPIHFRDRRLFSLQREVKI